MEFSYLGANVMYRVCGGFGLLATILANAPAPSRSAFPWFGRRQSAVAGGNEDFFFETQAGGNEWEAAAGRGGKTRN